VARFEAETGRFLGVFARGSAGDATSGEEASALQKFFYQNRFLSKAEREEHRSQTGENTVKGLPLIGPEDLAFTRDGDLLVTSFFTNRVLRFDAATGELRGSLGG